MDFIVFQRADHSALLVPALLLPPVAEEDPESMEQLGRCHVTLDKFSPAVAEQLDQHSYAVVVDQDWLIVRDALAAGAAWDNGSS